MTPSKNRMRVFLDFFPPHKFTRRSQLSVTWKRALTRHGISQRLVLGLPASRIVRSKRYLFQPPVWGNLLQQPELTGTTCIVTPCAE